MDEPRIALAASPREWAHALHRHVADHGGARVRATVLHQHDALAEDYDVFVADDSTSFLSRRLVEELHRSGRSVLGVFDPQDPRGKGELLDLGVDDVIARDAGPAAFVAALTELHARDRRRGGGEPDGLLRGLGSEPAWTAPDEGVRRMTGAARAAAGARTTTREPAREPGRLTAVGAAGGGAGATEVALALAAASGRRGDPTVLVDADEVAPALAQRIALPPYPNLRAAIDALEQRSPALTGLLSAVPGGGFDVLPGLSAPRGWAELRPLPAVEVLRALAVTHDHVIANVGARLEDVQGMTGTGRYGVSREVLRAAHVVVGVAHPTPTGLARLLEWIAEVRLLAPTAPIAVVFNRAPDSSFKRGELVAELTRSAAPASIWFAPEDPRVERAAWEGVLPGSGPFTRAVAEAAGTVLPTRAPTSRRRWSVRR